MEQVIVKGATPLSARYVALHQVVSPIVDGTQTAGTVLWQFKIPFPIKIYNVTCDIVAGTVGSGALNFDYKRPNDSGWTTFATLQLSSATARTLSEPLVLPAGTSIRIAVNTAGGTGLRVAAAIAYSEAHPLEAQ